MVGADIFMVDNKTLLCIVDCYRKFLIVKNVSSPLADDLDQRTKLILTECRLPKEIVSDAGTNFTSETVKDFYRKITFQQSKASSYYHQNNGQAETCMNVFKHKIKKCLDTTQDISLVLLQIQSMPLGAGLPTPVMMFFNRPRRGLLLQMNKEPININNEDIHYGVLESHQTQ